MAAGDQNLRNFVYTHGEEAYNLQCQCTSSSAELWAPTQEETLRISAPPHPYVRPCATAAEAQMWTAFDVLKQLDEKLRPIYDSLTRHQLTHQTSESLEQQNKIMEACETILETVKVIEKKIPHQPTAEGVEFSRDHSWCPNQPVYEVCTCITCMPVQYRHVLTPL